MNNYFYKMCSIETEAFRRIKEQVVTRAIETYPDSETSHIHINCSRETDSRIKSIVITVSIRPREKFSKYVENKLKEYINEDGKPTGKILRTLSGEQPDMIDELVYTIRGSWIREIKNYEFHFIGELPEPVTRLLSSDSVKPFIIDDGKVHTYSYSSTVLETINKEIEHKTECVEQFKAQIKSLESKDSNPKIQMKKEYLESKIHDFETKIGFLINKKSKVEANKPKYEESDNFKSCEKSAKEFKFEDMQSVFEQLI